MMNQYIYSMSDSSTHPGAALTRGPGWFGAGPRRGFRRVHGMIFVLKAMGLYSSIMFYHFFWDYYGLLWITMDYYGLLWITMDYYGLTGVHSD